MCVCVCVCVTISVCTCKYFCFFVYISACVCVCVYSIECLSYSSTYNMGRVCMLIFSSTMMIYDEKVRKHACVVNFIYIRDGMENNRFLQKYSLIFCCF